MISTTKEDINCGRRVKKILIRYCPKQKIRASNGIYSFRFNHCTDGNVVFVNL